MTNYPEIEIILADAPSKPIMWTVKEYIGSEIRHLPVDESLWPQTSEAWRDFGEDMANLWSLDDQSPREGDRFLAGHNWGIGIIHEDIGGIYGLSSDGNIRYDLTSSILQPEDDRNAWICSGVCNIGSIKRILFYQ